MIALRALLALAVLCVLTMPAYAGREISPVVNVDGCSAFFIGDKRFITAGHCAGNKELKAVFSDGRKATLTLLAKGSTDWALYEAASDYVTKGVKSLSLQCAYSPTVGDPIGLTGYPAIFGAYTVWGRIASTDTLGLGEWKAPLYRLNVSAMGGFSGSPVTLEASGLVIGILVGGASANGSLSFAQGLDQLCKVIYPTEGK